MSTPDQSNDPPLTRKQMRELRQTGATPVITPEQASEQAAQAAPEPQPAPVAPLPRAAAPTPVHTAPVPDTTVDLGAAPLTRRQARQQERIRTASIPVITPDQLAPVSAVPPVATDSMGTLNALFAPTAAHTAVIEPEAAPVEAPEAPASAPEPVEAPVAAVAAPEAPASVPERPVLNPKFGAGLLAGASQTSAPETSFEQLLARDTSHSGSVTAPSALIMSHTNAAPLIAPIAGTGELLVTGTFALPEGFGSTGQVAGTADGKEIDAVLVDGELPAHSSPTPIAASAAVSTVKTDEDVIQPPVPEKSGRLMLVLAITAGVLALALVGVLVYALTTGVIS